ncbi:hypothetical protein [Azohydromonas aeria]|uniref:hypothetical protein n=1 Tax=Azohydromonas aeria TaxID=2590212 RepID=UPI0018DF98D0|nr:hypothetical protein [Azohydromonas aeria]
MSALTAPSPFLSAQDLLAGALLVHEVEIPAAVLHPGQPEGEGAARRVRLRPLKVATLALISRAAQDDASLVPLLMVKESLAEPVLSFEQVRQLHAGLVQWLLAEINRISGLADDGGSAARAAAASPIGEAHVLLARHYGWTPQQVAELSPGQVAVYLAALREGGAGTGTEGAA